MTDLGRSRAAAEAARETQWRGESFLRELFQGRLRLDALEALHLEPPNRPELWGFYDRLEAFLREHVDPAAIDRTGEYPQEVLDGLAELGAFGMKIPTRYGGLGLTHSEYVRVMELVGSYDANLTALLSAHQAIGVPQPVLLFGTEEQRRRWLPRCARGAISAFALTEPAVGSDPARLETLAVPTEDGEAFLLTGEKLWCTNASLAELLVVMARNPETDRISAFVVEVDTPGVRVEHRCHFMGLRALANATVRFDAVRVPRENLIGEEGAGLRIALTTLNTGRITLPAATAGMAKRVTEIVRKWASVREQWGEVIGKHEAVASMNAHIVSSAYAMESAAFVVGELADRADTDIRLEAAAAKEWNTTRLWAVLDDALQVRGGRGYETADSLAERGEAPVDIERATRDARVNRIFEGSNEIMHLFIAREGLDAHFDVVGVLLDPRATRRAKLAALPRIALHYLRWYASLLVAWSGWPRHRRYGDLARYVRFTERAARRLARSLFYGMLVHRAGLERRQRFLFRAVDVALELFVLSCSVCRAQRMSDAGSSHAPSARALADQVGRDARVRVSRLLSEMWSNHDAATYRTGRALLEGAHEWLEEGTMGIGFEAEELVPKSLRELLEERGVEVPPSLRAAPFTEEAA